MKQCCIECRYSQLKPGQIRCTQAKDAIKIKAKAARGKKTGATEGVKDTSAG